MTRSKALSILSLVLLTAATTKPATKEAVSSRFYFPHFASGQANETTFVISNSSTQDADVRFTAYGDDGDLLALRSNLPSITVRAQSQTQIKAGELLDVPDGGTVSGWMKAESANPQLSAWTEISLGNIRGDKIDGLAASDQLAQKMAFSAVFQTADTITAIGLANPDNLAAHVKASLYSEGALADVREFQIPSHGHRVWFVNDLFQRSVTCASPIFNRQQNRSETEQNRRMPLLRISFRLRPKFGRRASCSLELHAPPARPYLTTSASGTHDNSESNF